jgi:hypothetical protein
MAGNQTRLSPWVYWLECTIFGGILRPLFAVGCICNHLLCS